MSDMDRILKLAGLATDSVAEATEKKMVCKDCGDELGNPQSECENNAYDKDGDHWIEIDVDGDGDADIKVARDMKDGMEEAVGDFADPILDLIDEVGSHQVVLDELIRYLDADTIEDFVADFRRHNDVGMEEAELDEDDLDENAFNQAAAAAARAGKPEFEFNGKTYKTKMDKSTAHKLDDDVQMSEGGHKDEIIDDAQSMDLEDFIEKHEGYGMDREECIAQWKYINGVKESSLEESSCGCCGNTPCDCADDCGCKESVNESPTMDTTQLITLLKNSGFTAEAIEEKLNEWANTPEGVGEIDPTSHGDAYEMAQSVNLSLKRYLDAQDMKVQVSESHTVESMKEKYKNKK